MTDDPYLLNEYLRKNTKNKTDWIKINLLKVFDNIYHFFSVFNLFKKISLQFLLIILRAQWVINIFFYLLKI